MEYPGWADHSLSAELPILRARGENQELEYMEGFPENVRELAKEIAAFATSNQGTILVGVSDEGDLIGLREAGTSEGRDAFLRRLEGVCSGTVKPAITPTARFAVESGKVVLVILVPKGSQPVYYCHEKPYLRHITESRPAQPHEVIELVSNWLASMNSPQMRESDAESQLLSTLASVLVDVLIYGDEMEARSVNPWLDMWRTQFIHAASELRDLAAEDIAQNKEMSPTLSALAGKLEAAGSLELYLGSGPELSALTQEAVSAAGEIKKAYIDLIPISDNSRVAARATVNKLARRLHDLSERADEIVDQGRIEEIQGEASEIGYGLLRLTTYANALPPEYVSDLAGVAKKLHLLETAPLFLDGGKSVESILQIVKHGAVKVEDIVSQWQ